jgi:hypothetical protein
MKTASKYILAMALAAIASYTMARPVAHHSGSEWSQSVHIPACEANQNLEIIWPATPNGHITIECNNLADFPLSNTL